MVACVHVCVARLPGAKASMRIGTFCLNLIITSDIFCGHQLGHYLRDFRIWDIFWDNFLGTLIGTLSLRFSDLGHSRTFQKVGGGGGVCVKDLQKTEMSADINFE